MATETFTYTDADIVPGGAVLGQLMGNFGHLARDPIPIASYPPNPFDIWRIDQEPCWRLLDSVCNFGQASSRCRATARSCTADGKHYAATWWATLDFSAITSEQMSNIESSDMIAGAIVAGGTADGPADIIGYLPVAFIRTRKPHEIQSMFYGGIRYIESTRWDSVRSVVLDMLKYRSRHTLEIDV